MTGNSDVALRLKTFLKSINLNVRQFEQKCGFSNGFVSNIKEQIRLNVVTVIHFHFPELNLNWLFTGDGEMLNVGYRAADLPKESAPGYQDASESLPSQREFDIHHNNNVNILNEKLENIQNELAELKKERKQLLSIIENLTK